MKFRGTPNLLVRFTKKNMRNGRKIGVRFDKDGIYETENPRIIKAFKAKFEVIEEDVVENEPVKVEVVEEVKVYNCKKCDFETDNKGTLMAHYRKEH